MSTLWDRIAGVQGLKNLKKKIKARRVVGGAAAASLVATGLKSRSVLLAALLVSGHRPYTVDSAVGTAVTNTTTETVLNSTSFPEDFLDAKKQIRWVGCVRATATHSTDTLTVKLRIGAAALTGNQLVLTIGATNVADNDVCAWDLRITIRSGTSAIVDGWYTTLAASGSTVRTYIEHQAVTLTNTSAATFLGATATWSVADAGNSCQTERWAVMIDDKGNESTQADVDAFRTATDAVTSAAATDGQTIDFLYIDT